MRGAPNRALLLGLGWGGGERRGFVCGGTQGGQSSATRGVCASPAGTSSATRDCSVRREAPDPYFCL